MKWINFPVVPIANIPQIPKFPCWGQAYSRLLSVGEFQLTEPRSAEIFVKLVEEAKKSKYIVSQKLRTNFFEKPLHEIKHL